DVAIAAIDSQKARIKQLEDSLKNAEAAINRSESTYKSTVERIGATKAQLFTAQDQLSKTIRNSPIDGVVSSLPVKEGEFVLASFNSSPLVMIADMADVNVEVKVDETDIANVRTGQPAKVKVDALGETEIDGEVTEIGHSAVTRSGQTIAQTSTSQEAKDFKVVIKLKANLETLNRLRPGMSATATVTTDTRTSVLAIPLQALVIKDLAEEKKAQEKPAANEAQKVEPEQAKKREEVQGVYVVKDNKAEFVVVKTGITGDTDIEVIEGLTESDKIVTGPFRELRNLKSGTEIKQESANKANKEKDEK
ncbi:MAG: HlyD family efflux transporter periplasmic adaptor subunit, partial [Blastocatellia bacterium]